MTQPALVSIILTAQLPVWLTTALDSALAQNYPHCEILIADSSGDRLVTQLIQPYLGRSGHPVRHLIYERSESVCTAAINAASGEYVKFLTQADRLESDCISKMVAGLQAWPQCAVAVAKRQRINPRGDTLPDVQSTAPLHGASCVIDGRDLLRYQTRAEYNLLGELSAALFYRRSLLPLLAKEGTPFSAENERQSANVALAVYGELLAESDALWLREPLIAVRVSDVYKQPHQREGDEESSQARKAIASQIAAQPWFSECEGSAEQVRVAELAQPLQFSARPLQAFQSHCVNQGLLESWKQQRRLEPYQQRYLQQLAVKDPQAVSVAVVIAVTDDNRAGVQLTLDSLAHEGLTTLQLHPILVGSLGEHCHSVAAYPATADTHLATINALIAEREEGWFIFVDAGTQFQPSGLIALSTTLPDADSVLAIYADEYFYLGDDPSGISFRPDFNLDLLLSSPKTMAQHWLFRRELLLAAEGFDLNFPQAAEFDLIVKMIESQGLNVAGHLAEPLLIAGLKNRAIVEDAAIIERHLHNRGYPDAQIALDHFYNYRLRYQHPGTPKVSIIILANWHLPSLISCVTSLLEKTTYLNYELLIVADSQSSPERDSWLTSIAGVDPQRIRVLQFSDSFQHAAMVNLAAEQALGDYLMLMHCELAVTDGQWLDNLLNHGQRPEVAVVGGKQLTSDNKIRHAGYILGMNGAAGDVFRGADDTLPSQLGRLHLDQNYSAVSGDFMLVRREVFDALGGFASDNLLYNDVDFCLRAREQGYMTVWTPYARILRPAARSNPFPGETVHSSSKLKQLEEDKLFARWMPLIAHDPAFNANLSLRSRQCEIDGDSLRNWRPVQREGLPVFLAHNADITGCGHYRMLKPLQAMQEEGLAEGKIGMTLQTISEIGQLKPDSLIIQRRYSPAFQHWIERTGKLHDVFKVFELDDYILKVPMKHNNRGHFRQEITGQLRKTLTFFDRYVVSTAPLAEAMSHLHPNIVVVKNRLPVEIWEPLRSLRNQGRKPRIGWAGGSSHRGDLEMIVDVVKEFTHEVEWVFLGMCPEKLRPYVHEIHHGVDISLYPAKLASLNLDLALAPVEDNIFNACKSNLRLLEYGVCGIPVICSKVACYMDDDLPVTRVSNRFIDWRDAIRMHLADPDASARMGDALRTAVRRDWMLTGDNVREWVTAWSAN